MAVFCKYEKYVTKVEKKYNSKQKRQKKEKPRNFLVSTKSFP